MKTTKVKLACVFTQASSKDQYKVTINGPFDQLGYQEGDQLVFKIVVASPFPGVGKIPGARTVLVVFTVSRHGHSATTDAWPSQLPMPVVGDPVLRDVVEIFGFDPSCILRGVRRVEHVSGVLPAQLSAFRRPIETVKRKTTR
jgi:hypothetical protein